MTHEELVEKVAREAVARDSGPQGSKLFEIHWAEFGAAYIVGARADISVIYEAMREPTDEMYAQWSVDSVGWAHVWREMLRASPLNGGTNAGDN